VERRTAAVKREGVGGVWCASRVETRLLTDIHDGMAASFWMATRWRVTTERPNDRTTERPNDRTTFPDWVIIRISRRGIHAAGSRCVLSSPAGRAGEIPLPRLGMMVARAAGLSRSGPSARASRAADAALLTARRSRAVLRRSRGRGSLSPIGSSEGGDFAARVPGTSLRHPRRMSVSEAGVQRRLNTALGTG